MGSTAGKILVIRGGAIGDFILTLPAIAALRRQFPAAHLEILGYPRVTPLAVAGGLVNGSRAIEARALAGFFARGNVLSEEWTTYFSEFDIILSYLYDPDQIFERNVRRCTRAQFIAGPHRADERGGLHAAKAYLKPLERLAIFDTDHVPHLAFQPATCNLQPVTWLALHPGSGSELKNWPQDKWAELLDDLMEAAEFRLLLVGGEAEGDRLQQLSRHARMAPGCLEMAQSLPLVELAKRMQQCAAFVGHDSGITHLAAAIGLPGLVLWADTPEEIWRPPSEKMIVVHHPKGLAGLEAREVMKQLRVIIEARA
ncbi:MAG: heptosyltransferase [Verrucomicrobiota bacterium]